MLYVFSEVNGNWETTTFIPLSGSFGDNLGSSIQAQNGEILIGATKDDGNGLNAGAFICIQNPSN